MAQLPIMTERLLIRDFVCDDWQAVHRYASDPDVVRYLSWGPNSEQDTRSFLAKVIGYQAEDPRHHYELAVVTKQDQILIGACCIHVSNPGNKEGWIGYCYNKNYWRNGYATEAAASVVDFGFGQLGLHRIYATCDPQNIGSAKVLENIGMTREGHLREHKWQKGRYRDSYLYSILEHEHIKRV